jgi:uncharacterized repeat protein (TIGR01451 family)
VVRAALGILAAFAALLVASPGGAQSRRVSPIDQILARCPTAVEVAAAQARTPVTFELSALAGPLVCHASSGSADLTPVELRTYQTLIVIDKLRFSQPLPWTPLTLSDWFSHSIRGIRMTDLPFGMAGLCCSPAGVIEIGSPSPSIADISRFADPKRNWNGPVPYLLTVMVHEARHAEGPAHAGHACGAVNDNTTSEYGAWGVQFGLSAWLALFSGSFLASPDTHPAAYRDGEFHRADVWRRSPCQAPFVDLRIQARDTPDPVVTGGTLTYSATIRNFGPEEAPGVLFYEDVPAGTRVTSVTSAQGTCTPPAEANSGAVGCRLGILAVNASKAVTIKFRVTAWAGTVLRNTIPAVQFEHGMVVISEGREPLRADRNNYVRSLQTTVKAKPKPKKTKPRR